MSIKEFPLKLLPFNAYWQKRRLRKSFCELKPSFCIYRFIFVGQVYFWTGAVCSIALNSVCFCRYFFLTPFLEWS